MGIVSQLIMVIKNLENPHTDYWKIQHELRKKNHGLPQPVFSLLKNFLKKAMDHIIYKYYRMVLVIILVS